MSYSNDKITIVEAIDAAGMAHEYPLPIGKRDRYYTCPVCGGKKKLNVDFSKNTFRCVKCGDSMGTQGSALDFFALLMNEFHSDEKLRRSNARKLYNHATGASNNHKAVASKPNRPQFVEPQPELRADPLTIDATYSRFLNLLSLQAQHKENLLNRGLSTDVIQKNGYRTAPTTENKSIAYKLLKEGMIIEGVPGFFKNEQDQWQFVWLGKGFLIPIRNIDGKIHGIQIRKDTVTEEYPARYMTISSYGKNYGTSGKAVPHFNPGRRGTFEKVILTEGALKADIIAHITGYPVLGMLGTPHVKNLDEPLDQLKSLGMTTIYNAFDMDKHENENVARNEKHMLQMLIEKKLNFAEIDWEDRYLKNKDLKGLDDILNSIK